MSVVIVGGHDRMVCQYMKICKNYKCKAKIFTQMSASMDKQMGGEDAICCDAPDDEAEEKLVELGKKLAE